MRKKILELKNAQRLTRDQLKSIVGGVALADPDLSKCGCSCPFDRPIITGPAYCKDYITCTCNIRPL